MYFVNVEVVVSNSFVYRGRLLGEKGCSVRKLLLRVDRARKIFGEGSSASDGSILTDNGNMFGDRGLLVRFCRSERMLAAIYRASILRNEPAVSPTESSLLPIVLSLAEVITDNVSSLLK